MNKTKRIQIALILGVVASALIWYASVQFESNQRERIIALSVEEQIKLYKARTIKACKKSALNEALVTVDSLLQIATALEMRDTNPFKPIKPLMPQLDTIEDTIAIEPLFYDSLRNSGSY